jgi:hypothetical protein
VKVPEIERPINQANYLRQPAKFFDFILKRASTPTKVLRFRENGGTIKKAWRARVSPIENHTGLPRWDNFFE